MSFARLSALWINSQNKQQFGKIIFKIQAFEVDINNNGISCNCYVKINNI